MRNYLFFSHKILRWKRVNNSWFIIYPITCHVKKVKGSLNEWTSLYPCLDVWYK